MRFKIYLLIIEKKTGEAIFSTINSNYHRIIFDKYKSNNINNEKIIKFSTFQAALIFKDDFIFAAIIPCQGERLFWDVIRNIPINKDSLWEIVKNFTEFSIKSEINLLHLPKLYKITRQSLNSLEKITDHLKNNKFLYEFIESYFPNDEEIMLIGDENSGLTSIFFLLNGLTITSSQADKHIIYKKEFNGKRIMFKKFNIGRGQHLFYDKLLIFEKKIFFIINSTNKYHINKNNLFFRFFKKAKVRQEILIIANKQDLPEAKKPEEIEKIMGYPTVGFSAIAPDAPERLEEIIADFLKDE